MEKYLNKAIEAKASDLFLIAGSAPVMRVWGELQQIGNTELKDKEIKDFFLPKLNAAQKAVFQERQDLDFRFSNGGTSMRVNIHQQNEGLAAAIRLIPAEIPTLDEIDVSVTIQAFGTLTSGLVLVTGVAGSGKSTTCAALIEQINQEKARHIITIEDPIEYQFENKKSIIEQREVGAHTPSFSVSLRHILRQNPDIIFIGEMRDADSVAAALTAAETGHLVLSTLHTPSAAETVERIIDLFPPERQRQILIQLSSVLRMVVSQRLLPRNGGGLIAAREVLINTPAVANLIRNNNVNQIVSVIQTSRKEGMVTMAQAVKKLVEDGLIDKDMVHMM